MKESAERFVNLMVDILEKGIDNIPPYVSDLLFRYSMMNLVYIIIGLGFFILAGALWKKANKVDSSGDEMISYVLGIGICITVGTLLITFNLQDLFIPEIGIISLLRKEM